VKLVAAGDTAKEIAVALALTVPRVEKRIISARGKLGARNVAHLAALWTKVTPSNRPRGR
jgi:DNA-binding CsgD family transcriptional regulator